MNVGNVYVKYANVTYTPCPESSYLYKVSQLDRSDPNIKVVDFDELYKQYASQPEEKLIGIDGKEIDPSTLDRIDPTKLTWYTVEFDPDVQLGVNYMRSCFDVVDDGKYNKLTAAENLKGMANAEIYKKIYEKYQYCYGENFYYAAAINYPLPPSDYDDYHYVIRRFERELRTAIGDDSKVREARREAFYGNMSDYEARQEIIEQYDLSDGLTFRELYQMTFDIWKAGLDGGLHNRLDDLFYDFSTADSRANSNNILTREKYLDMKVSSSYFDKLEKFYRSPGTQISSEYYTTLMQIEEAAGY
ncbi:MAG: hypothetical protein NC078_09945 [Ruminococcus sp.]|nr:hypothetical protein [Ruminococcus sp.]